MPDGRVRARVLVTGRVQGVFFRQETRRKALAAGVDGWVRNLPDGRVEAAFEGSRQAVDSLIGWVRRGPPLAHVTGVDIRWEEPEEEAGFRVMG
jgi:acylphosphatase